MALALAGGGIVGVFGRGALRGSGSSADDFVLPTAEAGTTPQPDDGTGVKQYDGPPAMSIDLESSYVATIKTGLGDIEVELLVKEAPETVNNFVFLARDGFYDGLTFHHVAGGFSATAGDPACTAQNPSCRGDGGPGYTIPDEPNDVPFEAGVLGMATRPDTPDSGGSQFFIALTESEQFDQFTAFGRIRSGLDVAEQLTTGTEIQTIEIQEQ
jgi:cyclophilin family peptidyl-prolyl cis-trans isomerase